MIRYALRCTDGHDFDSWFASADAFDALAAKDLVSCAVCGTPEVSKALMAPKVAPRSVAPDIREKIAAIRKQVESEATYVGPRFAAEARAIFESGENRPIYGEANAAEAKALIDDGIPVAPLPFIPKAKAN